MNLSKIHHIAIIVSDYEAAKDFYGVIGSLGHGVMGSLGSAPLTIFLNSPTKFEKILSFMI